MCKTIHVRRHNSRGFITWEQHYHANNGQYRAANNIKTIVDMTAILMPTTRKSVVFR